MRARSFSITIHPTTQLDVKVSWYVIHIVDYQNHEPHPNRAVAEAFVWPAVVMPL